MTEASNAVSTGQAQCTQSEPAAKIHLSKLLLAGAMSGAYLFSFFATESDLPGSSVCVFRTVTGLHCPSCGFSRGFIAISHGDLTRAVRLNVLSLPVYVIGLVVIAVLVLETARRRSLLGPWLSRHQRIVLVSIAVAITIRYLVLVVWH